MRHGDETGWRIQSLSETGRSRRAWLWISVSADAVYFLIDPSRSAEVAKTLFGATVCIVFLVCDRHGAYKKLARELGGKSSSAGAGHTNADPSSSARPARRG